MSKYTCSMETVQQNGRFTLFSSKFPSNIFYSLCLEATTFPVTPCLPPWTLLVARMQKLCGSPYACRHVLDSHANISVQASTSILWFVCIKRAFAGKVKSGRYGTNCIRSERYGSQAKKDSPQSVRYMIK